ncbi:HAD family hydrolase [Tessaracoccus rhinocerotis]|uniref:HAD family hydrolase n=1 Tax=Tessaracoccus rhinocerotis TaxID=1689449 RepID=A0A553K0P3_9ACTN|nr:HAD family hydrolase [Tessaracoccus rhinocerotis]TRY18274.1 HAD family hydrolase [Tessaracoccus rhinocerotis]
MTGYRHVFWDMGGTIVNTYPGLDAILAGVVRATGQRVSPGDVAAATRVSTGHAIGTLSERYAIPEADFRQAERELKQRWRTSPPPAMPGVKQVMDRVSGLNLVVTHRDRASATSLLEGLGITVDDLVCTDDGFPRKPDPAMYSELVRRHGLDVSECVGIGDRPIDAESAASAGMATVMLTTPGVEVPVAGDHQIDELTDLLEFLA